MTTYEKDVGSAAQYLVNRGIDKSLAVGARLGVVTSEPYPGHDRYAGWLAIPYLRHDGQAVSIRFRCISEGCEHQGHGKYMSVTGDPARTYNVSAVHESGDVLMVTEGEMDTLILKKVGYHSIAIPGASGWSNHHRRLLAGFRRVYVWGDGDQAGSEFSNRVCRSLRSAQGVHLPRGADVNSLYSSEGAEALHQLVKEEDRP